MEEWCRIQCRAPFTILFLIQWVLLQYIARFPVQVLDLRLPAVHLKDIQLATGKLCITLVRIIICCCHFAILEFFCCCSCSLLVSITGPSLMQSVGTPISATTMTNSDMSLALPPPGGHDDASQHSIASTSSSQQEQDHTDNENSNPSRQKCYKEQISHPPTPVSTLPSPGAASMSSYHDEFENASSPSWPRTPASPVSSNKCFYP